jgi:hypothetical protein
MRSDDDPNVDGLDDADRAIVEQVRALPPEGNEPDWKQLEAAIRAEVAPLALPAPWWRNWRWLVPIGALATTAAIVMTIAIRHGHGEAQTASRMSMRDASVPGEVPAPSPTPQDHDAAAPNERAAAMWLDGEPADLDDASESIDALDDLDTLPGLDAVVPERSAAAGEPSLDDDDGAELGVLPAADYQWIDTLRDDEAARLEAFLARKRS